MLAAFYKEAADFVLTTKRTGDRQQEIEFAERAAEARVFNLLYNLPAAIKAAEKQIEVANAMRDKYKNAQEAGLAGGIVERRPGSTPIVIEKGRTLSETLEKLQAQKAAMREGGN
jgi:hypothetical protein